MSLVTLFGNLLQSKVLYAFLHVIYYFDIASSIFLLYCLVNFLVSAMYS